MPPLTVWSSPAGMSRSLLGFELFVQPGGRHLGQMLLEVP